MTALRMRPLMWGFAGASLIFALGAYGGSVAGSERGGFTMNFPATGTEVGGPSPRELTGFISVGIDGAGPIKQFVQPNVLEISSHVVQNVGDTPLTIVFDSEGFPAETEWHSRDRAWNAETREIERPIAPGEAVDVSLVVTFPEPLPDKPILLKGSVIVRDADSGDALSTLPVTVVRSGASAVAGDCCE